MIPGKGLTLKIRPIFGSRPQLYGQYRRYVHQFANQRKYVLVINAGSSSMKFKLFQVLQNEDYLPTAYVEGTFERIGDASHPCVVTYRRAREGMKELLEDSSIQTHRDAFKNAIDKMLSDDIKCISDIVAVGHRVVHGGEYLTNSAIVDKNVESYIEKAAALAPLHNLKNLSGIRIARDFFGSRTPQVAVFDTSFHATIPMHAFLYALPLKLYQQHSVRKYGMHGTSYRYILEQIIVKAMKKPRDHIHAIILHLGAGSSMACIKSGICVDTSMGFTPLEGLVMATRSGDVDPGVFRFLSDWLKMSPIDIDDMLNKESGLFGLCGDRDLRSVLERSDNNDEVAKTAYKVLVHRIRKYLGAYLLELEGNVDVICFTAGMGENSARLRSDVLSNLSTLGVELDSDLNNELGKDESFRFVNSDTSKTKILVARTNEELQIALDTIQLTLSPRNRSE
mmetsp:Transcript_12146/g.21958  ORF Transcript_12146/g.21958 Transcript_12146/m.21958 type:complete len:452 (-) Transcript_12146:2319-3674(-)